MSKADDIRAKAIAAAHAKKPKKEVDVKTQQVIDYVEKYMRDESTYEEIMRLLK